MSKRTTLENAFYELFQEYFYTAEKYRRWNVFDDIPWDQARKDPNPDVVTLVESFWSVEMYLPDYVRHILSMVRQSRGRGWFMANWGYEECKHSMALEKWMLASGGRSDEEIQSLEGDILAEEWVLHYGDAQLLSLVYTVLQEFITGLTYKRLRTISDEKGLSDPALDRVLSLLHRDEIGHFNFFKKQLKLWLDHDRDKVLEALNHVLLSFHMPGADRLPSWEARDALIREWGVMTDRIFLKDVVKPVMRNLGIDHHEMRAIRKTMAEREKNPIPEYTEQLVITLGEVSDELQEKAESRAA